MITKSPNVSIRIKYRLDCEGVNICFMLRFKKLQTTLIPSVEFNVIFNLEIHWDS